MRLFLASYRFGDHADRLLALVGRPGPVAVIANAADAWPPRARESAVVSDLVPLRRLGFAPEEVDLRSFVGDPSGLASRLARFPLVWVRGGNTFVLRAQFARSGADTVLPEILSADALVYAGYSAGACVLTPTLRGLEYADDPAEVRPTCGIPPIWDGLGLVDYAIVPHVGSADLDESGSAGPTIEYYRNAGIEYRPLTDDEVIVVDGDTTTVM